MKAINNKKNGPSEWLTVFFTICLLFAGGPSIAQNSRYNTKQNIGWYNFFATIPLKEKWSFHAEYQWRRNEIITDWQQSLLRLGVNYKPAENILLRAGYGWIETFPYGEAPINGQGRDFTEHRIFEMIQLVDKRGRADISHRFMLEQRFVGKYESPSAPKEDAFSLLNRARYMVRIQMPITQNNNSDKGFYTAIFNEIFIGFGKNVAANIFDQNRLGCLAGYRFNKNFRIEGGYLSQILQLGRLVDEKNVFQYNNGLIINSYFSPSAIKK